MLHRRAESRTDKKVSPAFLFCCALRGERAPWCIPALVYALKNIISTAVKEIYAPNI